ncbi:Hypothetical protein, putative [Bodo saltans]|uniref:Stealth protein CR2 conserved region 2 domain-containing protein n=1 Tax=Bodo saltans TaxID=75058 RepID=A0A0S4J683_BODSA|nr:Hypothetical protein, putative [Bodo saltans]|eukprot:CUG86962.1 Hypothetical protein, putative [Bodo saltans]
MHFESSNDIASASAMVELHRSILHSCHRSFRWKAVLPGTSLQRLQALLLRKVVLLLCRRAAMRNHFDDFAEPSPASTSTTASPPPQSTASRMMQLCRMVETANTAMLNAKGTLHTVFNQVEEFKMLMWDALSTVFSSDQELANAVLDLSQDHAALEEVVQDALMDFASEQQQQCSPTYTTTTLASMTAAPPPFVDHYFPVDVSTASNINQQQQQLRKQQQQKNHHERSSSSSAQSLVSPGTAGTASSSSRGSRGSLNRSDGKLNHSSGSLSSSFLNGSASNLLNCRWGWCKKLVSRQSLVMMLFALVIVSLSTSHRSWQSLQGDSGGGGAAGGVGGNNGRHKRRHDHRHGLSDGDLLQSSLPMQSEQHHHQRVTHNHREDPATSMAAAPQHENKAANLVATTLQSSSSPSSVADAALRSTAARHKLNNDILDTLKQREKELIASMEQERAMREARRTFQGQEEAALQGQAAPQQAPPAVVGHHHGVVDSAPPSDGGDGVAATPEYPCGKDSVQNPSALPGRSFDAVDSITALSFDLTDHELDILHKLEAAKLASRHTYVRDLVARAMDADPRNQQSSYHTFFADRNATMETVDIDDVLEDNLLLRRRRENTVFTCPVAEPALVDAVYTYVNPDSVSHRMAISKPCRHGTVGGCSEQRFRDFNELMYSLRTVHHQGMHPAREGIMGRVMDDGEDESTATKTLAGKFVGDVYIVVADRDQIPHWLRHEPVNVSMSNNINRASKETSASPQPTRGVQSKGHVFSVTHEEIFPPELQQSALPTFNSFAIESNLHRIPGVRRFFVYFNNDMLWGRRVSYFDYFRPMSHIRQQFRIQTTLEGQCLAEHFRKAAATPTEGQQQQSGGTRNRSATASEMIGVEVDPLGAMSSPPTTRRAVVFMEPIYYFEQQDDIDVRLLIPIVPLRLYCRLPPINNPIQCMLPRYGIA